MGTVVWALGEPAYGMHVLLSLLEILTVIHVRVLGTGLSSDFERCTVLHYLHLVVGFGFVRCNVEKLQVCRPVALGSTGARSPCARTGKSISRADSQLLASALSGMLRPSAAQAKRSSASSLSRLPTVPFLQRHAE